MARESDYTTGRPTVMTPETISRLEDGFIQGLTDREASLYANIAPATLYAYCQENPGFSERKELLKESVKLRAKQNIASGINKGDKPLSQWYVERRDRDFNPKTAVDITTGGDKLGNSDEIKELTQKLNEVYRRNGEPGDGRLSSPMGNKTQD